MPFKSSQIIFLLCGLTAIAASAQNPAPTQATPFSAIQNTDRQVRTVINTANTYAAATKLNGHASEPAAGSSNTDAQKQLDAELSRFVSAVNGIGQFKKDLRNLDVQISLINNGITSLKVVNPSSDFLGDSFAEILTKNAIDILGSDVGNAGQKSVFQKIIGMLVSNPIVSGFLKSTPITSLAREAVSNAISVSGGKIQQSTIDKFNNTIKPYLEFYASIDDAADELQQNLVAISISVTKKQSKMNRLEVSINDLLDNYPGKNNIDRLKNLLQVNRQVKMTSPQVKDLLLTPDVRALNQLVDRQLILADDFIDDPVALQVSYNSYIDTMKGILTEARSTPGLKFDLGKLEEAIRQYKPI